MNRVRPSDQWLMSYNNLRKAVGLIGMALPIVLIVGKVGIEQQFAVAGSISSYYYTVMSSVFVGGLCSIAVFLIFYRGPEPIDNFTGHIAGISAIGVALFPTAPEPVIPPAYQIFPGWVATMHLVFAGIFFLALAYFCLGLFVKTKPGAKPTAKKKMRNKTYKTCGYVIVACLVLIAMSALFLEQEQREKYAVFLILESIAVFAFGVAWWVKGEAILKDDPI